MKFNKLRNNRVMLTLWFSVLVSFVLGMATVGTVQGQNIRRNRTSRSQAGRSQSIRPRTARSRTIRPRTVVSPPVQPVEPPVARDEVENAMGFVCNDSLRDPLGSLPIDVMQARESISLNHPDAVASAQRARRLLPRAKELAVRALRQVAAEYQFSPIIIAQAVRRIEMVFQVKADPELRDNASVLMSNPRVINFGTIFLVGLPSDEGMISVLSHELTHIADGKDGSLATLFARIGRRASTRTGLRITGQKAEELGCDLVGATAVQSLLGDQTGADEPYRRLARAIEHNCVKSDETDDEHLSPRNTMRALLSLNPKLARTLLGGASRPTRVGTVSQQLNMMVLPIPG